MQTTQPHPTQPVIQIRQTQAETKPKFPQPVITTFGARNMAFFKSLVQGKLIAALILWMSTTTTAFHVAPQSATRSSTRLYLDQQVLMGGGIAFAGLAAGIGLVAFTENQGERAKERGSGLSDGMATRITGQLMEDVEVSSVEDLGSLTSQLEKALKEAGKTKAEEFEMTEEEKKRIAAEADDGW